jgi:hypothetical protein
MFDDALRRGPAGENTNREPSVLRQFFQPLPSPHGARILVTTATVPNFRLAGQRASSDAIPRSVRVSCGWNVEPCTSL